jgi:prolipoprotein diacylglyceryltransferase
VPGGPRHPTQLYLALAHLIFFIISWHLIYRKKGGLFIRFVLWYSTARFFIEFIRVHKNVYSDSVAFIAPLNVFQLVILIWGIPAFIRFVSEYYPKKHKVIDYSDMPDFSDLAGPGNPGE